MIETTTINCIFSQFYLFCCLYRDIQHTYSLISKWQSNSSENQFNIVNNPHPPCQFQIFSIFRINSIINIIHILTANSNLATTQIYNHIFHIATYQSCYKNVFILERIIKMKLIRSKLDSHKIRKFMAYDLCSYLTEILNSCEQFSTTKKKFFFF